MTETTNESAAPGVGTKPGPSFILEEALEVLRTVETQFRATGQPSERVERLINLLAGMEGSTAAQPPAEAQAVGGGEVDDGSADASVWTLIALMERVGGERDSGDEGSFITMTLDQVYALESLLTARGHDPGWVDITPPSAPGGVEAVDAAAWNEVLELPPGSRVAEHLPGTWEYQFDIEDKADEDSDRMVSGTSWNHPALAAIAAWSHAYDALSQQPAASLHVECRECRECEHVGINDEAGEKAACLDCDWAGDAPVADKCPSCASENCMSAACPKCGALYRLVASADVPDQQPAAVDVGQFRPAVATHQLVCRKRVRDCREGALPAENLPIYLNELAEASRLLDVIDLAAQQGGPADA